MTKMRGVVAAVIAVGCLWAGAASADPGNGQRTIQFAVSYELFPGGPTISCQGDRIVTTGPNASTRDRETCQSGAQLLPAVRLVIVAPDAADGVTTIDWLSDYDFFVSPGGGAVRFAVGGTVDVHNSPDGSQTVEIHAQY